MELTALSAISPIDGRYRSKVSNLAPYFSEFGLIRYRVLIEIEYFIALSKLDLKPLAGFPEKDVADLRALYLGFNEADATDIKSIERTTNHDVKAVEYWIKDKLKDSSFEDYLEYIHFGLTSQDINNSAIPLLLKEACEQVIVPSYWEIQNTLERLAKDWMDIPMLARTHGQPASPTRLGKEIAVFANRLKVQLSAISDIPHAAKFGGATGNFNAHFVAFPEVNWEKFGKRFIKSLGLKRSVVTTQIEHYDQLAAMLHNYQRVNTILIDFSRDVWQYISQNFFLQHINANEVGSSAMPHKVNPIDFENAEGNLGIANAIMSHLASKLPISRLQRDLTDSTVLRNIGVPFAHNIIALKSLQKGIGKLKLNQSAINADLENHWEVVAEAIQTVLRREKFPKPYEALKELTRTNEKINQKTLAKFINGLKVSKEVKKELLQITPFTFTGIKPSKF